MMRSSSGRWFLLVLLAAVLAAVGGGCGRAKQGGQSAQSVDSQSQLAAMPHGVEAEDLPITKVSLYQNGVGYFERTGEVDGDVVSLRIRPDQINDILKSLTVIDLDKKGKALSISLPADREAVSRLDDLPPQIREQGGLLELLHAFRGARVTLDVTEPSGVKRQVNGRIVGTESIATYGEHGSNPNWRVMMRKDDESLEIVQFALITGLKIQDRTLEVGLEKSLDMSLNEGSWKPIELKVRLDKKEKRRIQVSYIVSMPVWKPAYRLRLGEGADALFQGWSVVDNVSGADWNNVQMALVAGNPTSFVYNLYTPQFVSRSDLSHLARKTAYAPPAIESARGQAKSLAMEGLGATGIGAGGGGGMGRGDDNGMGRIGYYDDEEAEMVEPEPEFQAAPANIGLDDYAQNFDTASSGQQLSTLFEYQLAKPVSIPDRSSSLVNIVEKRSNAREVALFNPAFGNSYTALHPYRAVEFTNDTGFALEPGPITLYRQSTFIGEGFLSTTAKDQVAFITFALDPQVMLKTSELETEQTSHLMRIKGGVIETEILRVNTVEYELRNDTNEDVEAVIRRAERAGWKLDPTPENTKLAAGVYFVSQKIPAGQTVKIKLRETTPSVRTFNIDSTQTIELLTVALGGAELSAEVKAELQKVVDARAKLNEINLELQTLRTQKYELETELAAKTRSLNELETIKDPGAMELRKKLLTTANELQTQINQRTTRIITLDQERLDKERLMRSLFQSISFERKP
jgi:hypothetical protein